MIKNLHLYKARLLTLLLSRFLSLSLIIFSIIAVFSSSVNASKPKTNHVIMFVDRVGQQDSLGYNIVDQLPKLIYNEVVNHRLKVWDSPKKNLELSTEAFLEVEKSSGLKFSNLDNFFVYEYWTDSKTRIDPEIVGFHFAIRNKAGQDVSLGYVEYPIVKNLLMSNYVEPNANGYPGLTFDDVFLSQRFNYTIVQYEGETFTNKSESDKFRKELLGGKMIQLPHVTPIHEKHVVFAIDKDTSNIFNLLLLDTLRQYFNANIEEFFNLGGDKMVNFVSHDTVIIDRVEICEKWYYEGDELYSLPYALIIYDKNSLNPIPYENVVDWKITVVGIKLDEFLRSKIYSYRLARVNQQNLKEEESSSYLDALKSGKWDQLTKLNQNNSDNIYGGNKNQIWH